jgi:hypothetical protein
MIAILMEGIDHALRVLTEGATKNLFHRITKTVIDDLNKNDLSYVEDLKKRSTPGLDDLLEKFFKDLNKRRERKLFRSYNGYWSCIAKR